MRIVKNNKRISVLGLIKFFAAIAIVYFHTLPTDPSTHWWHLWLLVELFFFITGYFTFKHFRKKENRGKTLEQQSKNAISYTVKKFLPLIPFVIVAIVIKYIALLLRNDGATLSSIMKILPLDILLLNSQTAELNWPLWYLSAMLIVFPLFCLLCQTKRKNTLYITLFTTVVVYYFNFFKGDISGPSCLIRAFIGMSAGILVYALSTCIRKNVAISKNSKLMLVIFLVLITVSILCLYPSRLNNGYELYGSIFLIMTILWLSILLSGKTFLSHISSPLMDYLERISMIIYMIHISIIYILSLPALPFALSGKRLALAAILLSVILSIILNAIIPKIISKFRIKDKSL